MSGAVCGYCNDEDVSGDCTEFGAHVGVEMACSSAMPGCATQSSVQTWPPRFSESLALRTTDWLTLEILLFLDDSSRGLAAMTFSLVRVSSSALIGGLGRALFFCIGGLTRRGGVGTASFSSVPLVAFSELVDW